MTDDTVHPNYGQPYQRFVLANKSAACRPLRGGTHFRAGDVPQVSRAPPGPTHCGHLESAGELPLTASRHLEYRTGTVHTRSTRLGTANELVVHDFAQSASCVRNSAKLISS